MNRKIPKSKVKEFIKNPRAGLFKLALPILFGMLAQSLYNITDTAYVGHLGAESLAAVTFAFPLFFVMIALGAGLSTGMQSRISRYLGAGKIKAAENTVIHAGFLGLVVAIILMVPGVIFIEEIFLGLGASGTTLELSMQYMNILFLVLPLWMFNFLISRVFIAQGDTKTAMILQVISVMLNLILDPIFIYGLGMGVKGAAIATAISIIVAFILGAVFIITRSSLRIHLNNFSYRTKILKDILKVGIPAGLTMITMATAFMFYNRYMAHFGTEYVAALGMAGRLWSGLVTMPMVAIGTAVVTLVGIYWGAKRYDLVDYITSYAIKVAVGFSIVSGGIIAIYPKIFLRIFTSDAVMLDLGESYMRIIVIALPLIGISMLTVRSLQGMGYGFPGLIIMMMRSLFIAIPIATIMIFVLNWSYLSVAYADISSAGVGAIVGYLWMKKKIREKIKNTKVVKKK